MMKTWILPVLYASFSAVGFGLIYGMRTKKLFYTALGAALTWLVFLLAKYYGVREFYACACAAAFSGLYSELMARLIKVPVTAFIVPVNIPMVPGGALYHSFVGLLSGDIARFAERGTYCLSVAGAMALGIFAASMLTKIITSAPGSISRRRKEI